MKRMIVTTNPRKNEYFEYLEAHISGVIRSWEEILRTYVEKNYPEVDLGEIDRNIRQHDASKYEPDEFDAYCNYFYPCPGFEKDEDAFDYAWLMHQHRNPHHHQHWVLIRDEGEKQPLDMHFKYICEMLCDWHSFSLKDPKSTAYNWWTNNRENMMLSEYTISIIEDLIEAMKMPLEK